MALNKPIRQQRDASGFDSPLGRAERRPCVLDLWATSVGRNEMAANALGRLLLAQPALVNDLHDLPTAAKHLGRMLKERLAGSPGAGSSGAGSRGAGSSAASWLVAAALVLEADGRRSEALALCSDALPALLKAGAVDPFCIAMLEPFLRRPGVQDGQAFKLFLQLRSASLIAQQHAGSDTELRGLGLDAFVAGRLDEAERIYRHLIARDFEPGGTRCHLARVLIAAGREREAAALARQAWDYRDREPLYIRARMLYLQALLAALAGENPQAPLSALKEFTARPAVRMDWTMVPVLERVAPRLSAELRELFSALLATLSSGGLPQLEALPAWRRIPCAQTGEI
jgi:tetratricopeptide (TPR) repeat protein